MEDMSENITNLYILASSKHTGALAIFQAYADEAALVDVLDSRTGPGKKRNVFNPLHENELRYGWLRDEAGEWLDEVMLAKPADNIRLLMTHGGAGIRDAIQDYFKSNDFRELDDALLQDPTTLHNIDDFLQPMLSSCVTETQVFSVLDAVQEARQNGTPLSLPYDLLVTHRVVLAGAPNAGKSSLLNQLAGYDRAFVHHQAGATVDVVEELVDLGGYAVIVGDMPGFSGSEDELGRAAWKIAVNRVRLAEAVFFVCDGSEPWSPAADAAAREISALLAESGHGHKAVLVIVNKSDLPGRLEGEPWRKYFPHSKSVFVCSIEEGNARAVLAAAAETLWAQR